MVGLPHQLQHRWCGGGNGDGDGVGDGVGDGGGDGGGEPGVTSRPPSANAGLRRGLATAALSLGRRAGG